MSETNVNTNINANTNFITFTFRNIPKDISDAWKLAATFESITKEELGAKWIAEGCKKYFDALAVKAKSGDLFKSQNDMFKENNEGENKDENEAK